MNQAGTIELHDLFGIPTVDYPKPVSLIAALASTMGEDRGAIILDFFAGSGTTAHAVMHLNVTGNEAREGTRRYILVQLPEPLDETKILDDGTQLETIADITRERVRRAGRKIREENAGAIAKRETPLDTGFRAYKLAPSNFQPWNGDIANGDIAQQLDLMADHTNADATDEALLAELLLKIGLELTCAVSTETIAGKKVFNIEDGAVLASFDRSISLDLIEAMAARQPSEIICLDAGFPDDQTKVNAGQIIASHARHAETSIAFKVI